MIIIELGNELFAILLDESRDVSVKEQVTIAIRLVNSRCYVIERFLGIVHIKKTFASTPKRVIEAPFAKHWQDDYMVKVMMRQSTCMLSLMDLKL